MLKKLIFSVIIAAFSTPLFAADRSFEIAAVEINGAKFWLPSSITVKKGDKVKIHAVSKVPGENSVHGITIEEYKIVEVADNKKGSTIEFTADKSGVFQIKCHMHPPHIGAQLIVLE